MINAGGSDNVGKSKKLMEQKNRWDCTIHFYNKIKRELFFYLLLLPIVLSTSLFSVCCIKWQHAVFWNRSGKRNRSYFSFRSTNGTPHSSSDLLYFTFILPFTWTNYFMSNSLSLSRFFGQNKSKSNTSSLFSCWTKNSKSNSNLAKKSTSRIFFLT